MVQGWKERVEKAGISVSRFVVERVEDSIKREGGEEGYLNRLGLTKRLKDAEEEARKLRE
ncbi:MAG: hypothetical protein QW587_08940 [Candidatus Bathyarchaeia archaeon]